MVAILGANSVSGGYEVSNSLRFNSGDSPILARTPSSAGDGQKFTYSTWFKRSEFGAEMSPFLHSGSNASNYFRLNLDSGNTISTFSISGGSTDFEYVTTQVFRDPSAWYHLVFAVDTTNGTEGNRLRLYINGSEVTSFSTETHPSQNLSTDVNGTTAHYIGRRTPGNDSFYDGYLTETHLIDGQQLAPTSFGEFDNNGVWIPIKYTGTYGTNGFFLQFKQTGTSQNSSGIGADTSGNDNHFAVTNFAATDITEDTCTNNFATLNALFRSNFDNDGTYAEGNCERDFTADNANRGYGFASFGVTSGKWYWEVKIPTVARANTGIGDVNAIAGFSGVMYDQNPSKGFMINYNGQIEENATATSYASSLSDNDIVMWALDMDNHRAYYGINGTWQDSGDPTSGSTGTGDVTTQISDQSHLNTGEPMFPFCFDASTSGQSKFQWNFGNPIHSISSGNTDGKYGNFEYAPPSGYYALCTKNLAEYG